MTRLSLSTRLSLWWRFGPPYWLPPYTLARPAALALAALLACGLVVALAFPRARPAARPCATFAPCAQRIANASLRRRRSGFRVARVLGCRRDGTRHGCDLHLLAPLGAHCGYATFDGETLTLLTLTPDDECAMRQFR